MNQLVEKAEKDYEAARQKSLKDIEDYKVKSKEEWSQIRSLKRRSNQQQMTEQDMETEEFEVSEQLVAASQ